MGAAVVGLMFGVWTLWYGRFIVGELRKGVTSDRGKLISRTHRPICFWVHIIVYGAAWLMGLAVSLLMFRIAWVGCPLNSTIRTCNPLQGIL
jgi:hypothetical protein